MTHSIKKPIYNIIKTRFLIYLIIIGVGLSTIFGISYYSGAKLQNDAQIISILGKQRMLTQAISKNASRVSIIKTSLLSGNTVQSESVLLGKLSGILSQMNQDALEYEKINAQLSEGFIVVDNRDIKLSKSVIQAISDDLMTINTEWPSLKASILKINKEKVDSEKFKLALIFINENNQILLEHSSSIVTIFEKYTVDIFDALRAINLGLVFVVIALAALLMYQMYSDLFKALNVFYSGLDRLGARNYLNANDSQISIADEVHTLLEGFTDTLELTEKINSSDNFEGTLDYIYNSFRKILPYTYIGIALLKDEMPLKLVAKYGIGDSIHEGLADSLVGNESVLSDTSLESIMLNKEPRIINDLDAYLSNRVIKPYSQKLLDHGIKASITLPLEANGMPLGFIFFSSNRKNAYQSKHVEYLKIISNSIALSFQKNIIIDELVYTSILALAKLSEARDEDTGDHLIRMSNYVEAIAQELRKNPIYKTTITNDFITELVKFSPMHDIGKVGIPDAILLKPGKLTFEEFEIMKTHTDYGANVLIEAENNINRKGRSVFTMGIEIAKNHHEKFDGSGYPAGLVGNQIPLSARIVAVADVYDALLSKRPYKEPFTMEETLRIINEGRGKHFDPDVVDALMALKRDGGALA